MIERWDFGSCVVTARWFDDGERTLVRLVTWKRPKEVTELMRARNVRGAMTPHGVTMTEAESAAFVA